MKARDPESLTMCSLGKYGRKQYWKETLIEQSVGLCSRAAQFPNSSDVTRMDPHGGLCWSLTRVLKGAAEALDHREAQQHVTL